MPDINTITFEDFFKKYDRKNDPVNMDDMAVITALFRALSPDQKNAEAVEAAELNNGLFGYLSDNERNALALDKNIQSRMSIRNGELWFDDISLQTRTAQTDTTRLEELKKSISVSCNAHLVEDKAEFVGFDENGLNMNKANLKDALNLLDSTNHWYNSSDEFRKMYNSLKTLSENADKLDLASLSTLDKKQYKSYLKDLDNARIAAENYLTHKGALDGKKVKFKNSYEADRVAAARGLLRALKEKENSFIENRQLVEARADYDRLADYLAEKHKVDREKLTELKDKYCNIERVRMHNAAKAAVRNRNNKANEALEKFNKDLSKAEKMKLPAEFVGTYATYITDNDEKNKQLLSDIKRYKNSKGAKSRMQRRYIKGISSARSLEKDKLQINEKLSSMQAAKYAIDHVNAVQQGSEYPNSKFSMMVSLGLSAKQDVNADINNAHILGRTGQELVDLMADDKAYFLPLDDFVKDDEIADFLQADNQLKDSTLIQTDKDALTKFYNCAFDERKGLRDLGKVEPRPVTADDFDGVIEPEVKLQKKAEPRKLAYQITTDNDVLKNADGLQFVQGSINGDDSMEMEADEKDPAAANQNTGNNRNTPDAKRKPEDLLDDHISMMIADEKAQAPYKKISQEIRNARARIEANSNAHNIYPEAADDMRMLVLAEEIKEEIIYKRNHPTKTTHFLTDRLLRTSGEEAAEKFLNECENKNLEKSFDKKMAIVKNPKTQKDLMFGDDIMKDFADGHGARRAFETYRDEAAAIQKQKDSNVKIVTNDMGPRVLG